MLLFFYFISRLNFMKQIQFSLLLLLTFLFTACTLDAIPSDKESYIGQWESNSSNTKVKLIIKEDASVIYTKSSNSTNEGATFQNNTSINSKIEKFDGDDFIVTLIITDTRFVVSSPPKKIGNNWEMTVDGIELKRAKI